MAMLAASAARAEVAAEVPLESASAMPRVVLP
jgi:hypothetical protein